MPAFFSAPITAYLYAGLMLHLFALRATAASQFTPATSSRFSPSGLATRLSPWIQQEMAVIEPSDWAEELTRIYICDVNAVVMSDCYKARFCAEIEGIGVLG